MGTRMFQVVSKLKKLKGMFKDLNKKQFSDIEVQALKAKKHMLESQRNLDKEPFNMHLISAVVAAVRYYNWKNEAALCFLHQKPKLHCLKYGDANSGFFHRDIKARIQHNRVYSIQDRYGAVLNGFNEAGDVFVDYFSILLRLLD